MEYKDTYKVRTTLLEMLKDRGYDVPDNITIDEFQPMYESDAYDVIDKDKKIIATFYKKHDKAFGKADLRDIVRKIRDENGNEINIIIIITDKPNSAVESELLTELYRNVEVFIFNNMKINITRHRLQPKYTLLSEEEMGAVLEKYNATKSQIPRMLITDPIARYYGVKSNSMFKIVRNSPSTGENTTYRYIK